MHISVSAYTSDWRSFETFLKAGREVFCHLFGLHEFLKTKTKKISQDTKYWILPASVFGAESPRVQSICVKDVLTYFCKMLVSYRCLCNSRTIVCTIRNKLEQLCFCHVTSYNSRCLMEMKTGSESSDSDSHTSWVHRMQERLSY